MAEKIELLIRMKIDGKMMDIGDRVPMSVFEKRVLERRIRGGFVKIVQENRGRKPKSEGEEKKEE